MSNKPLETTRLFQEVSSEHGWKAGGCTYIPQSRLNPEPSLVFSLNPVPMRQWDSNAEPYTEREETILSFILGLYQSFSTAVIFDISEFTIWMQWTLLTEQNILTLGGKPLKSYLVAPQNLVQGYTRMYYSLRRVHWKFTCKFAR